MPPLKENIKTQKQLYTVLALIVLVGILIFVLSSPSKTDQREETAQVIEKAVEQSNAVY